MPIFVTFDAFSDGFKINFNSDGVTMTDDIKIENKFEIKKPIYEFKLNNEFTNEKKIHRMYSFYLAYRNLKKYKLKYKKNFNFSLKNNKFEYEKT